jgi:hypothetical protein
MNFVVTFSFKHDSQEIDTTLKEGRDKIFEEPKFEIILAYQSQARQTVKQLLHCYHVAEEKEPTEDTLRNIQIS